MDQAALAYQGVLRHVRERGKDSDLDRRMHLRAAGDRAQAAEVGVSMHEMLQI